MFGCGVGPGGATGREDDIIITKNRIYHNFQNGNRGVSVNTRLWISVAWCGRPQGCRHLRRVQCPAPLGRRCSRVALPATAASGITIEHSSDRVSACPHHRRSERSPLRTSSILFGGTRCRSRRRTVRPVQRRRRCACASRYARRARNSLTHLVLPNGRSPS